MEITLASQFPDLSFAKLADAWLLKNKDTTILEQVESRRIVAIEFAKLDFGGDMGSDLRYGGGISIRLRDSNTMEENIRDLGHEIGHTFHFNLESKFPLPNMLVFFAAQFEWLVLQEMVERFCDEFSRKWLAINGEEKVIQFCEELPFFAKDP